ncbi:dynein heavy chain, cytoplasmic-like [Penaeus chinensis]|uniref:dynein heavy chain, cytoplasmic-like n=1 Tax=Penaeus chinensis TaxID=139456 RepID=UPI001FB58383|nr:dynein heavy chain, cytoplasmic-like [Penaeus chinensis]
MFLVKVSVEESVIVCIPTQEALMGGLRTVVRMCEMTVLSIQPLLPYFTPHDRLSAVASEENTVLRTMLEDDSLLKESIGKVLSLVEDKWQKVEAEVNPLDDLLKEAQTPPREEGIQDQDMNELGSWLGRVEGLVETVRSIREVVNLGLLQVDQTAARRVLVTSLRQQQQRMHQDVSQGFDQRVKKLQAEATDKWLGLEMAPVTAQQVVTLLNYVTEVKKEMERVNGEESVILQAYAMIQGYHITLHPEVHNKYEALQKELKRLRKCVRRSLMERPTMIRKLNQLLQKEIEELDAETVKLSEQVQLKVCNFKELAVVEEEIALKMLLWRSPGRTIQREVRCLDVIEVTQVTLQYREKADYLVGATQQSDVLQHLNTLVSQMQEKLPVLEALTDSALRPRHWQEIDTALGRALPPNLTLAHVDEMSLHTHAHTLQQVAHTAQLQREMENRLKKLEEDWEVAIIPVQPYTRKDLYVLDDLTDLESLLLASDLTLHLLLHSQHALHIKNESVKWKNIHTIIKETVAALRDFEGEWLALDLVLSSCTAMDVFPLQAAVFSAASSFWSATLSRLKDEPRVLSQLRDGMLLEELLQQRGQLEDLRACVSPLLGMRKQTCPRLFVLPDQDVVELLTKGQDLEVCHKYLRRMFTGVGRLVKCKGGQIVALVSPQQETLHLAKPVIAHHGVEDWLGRVESGMRATIRRLILKHVEDDLDLPTSELPLQVLDVCKRIQWSREVNRAFAMVSETQDKPDLQRVLKRIINVLDALTNAVRHNQSEGRTVSPLKQARMSYLTATLLELRDTTQTLVQDNPSSSLSYSWLQHLRHVITGEGRGAGVHVSVGVGQLDYGYEYMGVSPATIPTPTTLKAQHGLITAAIQNRCGAAVGGVGGGKTETVKGVARAAGQHLAMLTCSDRTPAQSLQHVVCAGVQGGYWLLLEDADLLPPTLLSRLSQYAHNIYQAKVNALKRGVIDGQEMNLVDSFTLFMSVTSQDDATVTSSYPLLNHPITPHLTSVSVCPPTLNTLLEAMLIGQGFNLSREYLQKARTCFVQLTNLVDVAPPTSLARLVQATARVSCDIRHTSLTKKEVKENENSEGDSSKTETADEKENEKCERGTSSAVSLWMRHPLYPETMSDEDIVTQALYAVTSPLLSEKEALWRQEFNKIFDLEDAEDHQGSPDPCDIEVAVKEVLLEWGYGDADDAFLKGESKLAYEVPDESDIIRATQEGQQMIAEDAVDEKEKEKQVPKEENGKEMEENVVGKEEELSSHGASIMKAALHMYSLLIIHHCCCIMAPSGAGKSVVWKVLAEALNRLRRSVSWRVLQCGAFTRDHLLGNWDEERRMWRKGVLLQTLTESQQSPGERWLVLMGPFSHDILKSLSHLCHTSPAFKDEALNQVILEGDVRIIIEQSEEKNLISHARVRCPILKLPAEAMTASGAAGRAMKRLLKVLPHLQGQREISEARSLVAEGLVNLELPQTSLMRVAGIVCRMAEARVTPATPPGELLEVLQQVLELLHTARHPHLHQDAREGAYTPARPGFNFELKF